MTKTISSYSSPFDPPATDLHSNNIYFSQIICKSIRQFCGIAFPFAAGRFPGADRQDIDQKYIYLSLGYLQEIFCPAGCFY
jgi:hypothetical protein